ncbi:hypothetical protein Aconfl_42820 [Algoriphagus confluentis]|uniref:Uncharacterized protein n=1 Tax=Algoriphagus confluentis TaxID=1697556 RepID=A0ABQ6PUN7_9BACT|nr:hypothetical protein Aconfl_42820 [Algoriphagus confluentis]
MISMKFFYLSSIQNADGNHEIHEKECPNIPDLIDRDYLGPYNHGNEALRKALEINSKSVCCPVCCTLSKEPVIFSKKRNLDGHGE